MTRLLTERPWACDDASGHQGPPAIAVGPVIGFRGRDAVDFAASWFPTIDRQA